MKISVRDLVVRYGKATAVDRVSFEVAAGAVWALTGRNGAGKSSLLKVLLGQRRADGGEVAVLGRDPWRERVHLMRRIGATPETPDAPPDQAVTELERTLSSLHPTWDGAHFRSLLTRFEVPPRTRFGALSRGQRSLVMLAFALAPRPELLLLDDPTLGLDAVARRYVFDELIGELAERGTTVLLASHDLEGVQRVATHVGMLRDGHLVAAGEIEGLRAAAASEGITPPTLEEIFVARTGSRREP